MIMRAKKLGTMCKGFEEDLVLYYYGEIGDYEKQMREQKFCWRNLFAPIRMWMIPAVGTAVIAALAFGLVLSKGNLSSLYNQAPDIIPREIVSDTEQLEFFRSLDMLEALSALEGMESSKADSH